MQDIQKVTIGNSTLYCGDALQILPSLKQQSFGGLIADPPYASGGLYAGNRRKTPQEKYVFSEKKYTNFEGDQKDQRSQFYWSYYWLSLGRELLKPGSLAVIFTDWRQLPLTTDFLQAAGLIWRGIVSWDKTEACRSVLGRYRNQAEYAVWGTIGKRKTIGKTASGAYRIAVGKKLHMTAKPVELMEHLLSIMETPVLDPFMGAGAVGVACARLGIPYTGIEISPEYFEIACRRIEEALNKNRSIGTKKANDITNA